MPLIVSVNSPHDFEMDERNYLLQSEACFVKPTPGQWRKNFSSFFKISRLDKYYNWCFFFHAKFYIFCILFFTIVPSSHELNASHSSHHFKIKYYYVFRFLKLFYCCCCQPVELKDRIINLGTSTVGRYPPNVIRNQKYNLISFFPKVLFEQFRFFLNFYFLIMALSQFIPDVKIGYLYTYWGPLAFVIIVTVIREG